MPRLGNGEVAADGLYRRSPRSRQGHARGAERNSSEWQSLFGKASWRDGGEARMCTAGVASRAGLSTSVGSVVTADAQPRL